MVSPNQRKSRSAQIGTGKKRETHKRDDSLYVLDKAIAQQYLVRKLVSQEDKDNTNTNEKKIERIAIADDITYYRIPPTAVPSRISKLFGRVCIEYPALHASTYKHFYIQL